MEISDIVKKLEEERGFHKVKLRLFWLFQGGLTQMMEDELRQVKRDGLATGLIRFGLTG